MRSTNYESDPTFDDKTYVVYNLSYSLFGKSHVCNGIDSGPDRCHSNDHSNGMKFEKGVSHSDGGYALNHQWL